MAKHKLRVELERRVHAGASLLDIENPDWALHINEPLCMQSTTKDVLGQLYTCFAAGLAALKIRDPSNYGFDLPSYFETTELRQLDAGFNEPWVYWEWINQAWIAEIEVRVKKV